MDNLKKAIARNKGKPIVVEADTIDELDFLVRLHVNEGWTIGSPVYIQSDLNNKPTLYQVVVKVIYIMGFDRRTFIGVN